MFTNKFQTKTAKLARYKSTGKFGCTVSVFILSVMIVVRVFGGFLFYSVLFCSSAYAMTVIQLQNIIMRYFTFLCKLCRNVPD